MNDDAENSLSEIKLKGKKITYALESILNAYDENGYYDGESEQIYISVYSEKNKNFAKLSEKLTEKAEKVKGDKGYFVNSEKTDKKDKDNAKESGVSPVKYRMINEILTQYPDTHTFDELCKMKMSELKKLLK